MSEAKKSTARKVLLLGIALAALGLGAIAYIPRSDPAMLAGATITVMVGYMLGRWAVHRMASEGDDR